MTTGGAASDLLHADDAGIEAIVAGGGAAEVAARSPLQLFWRRLRRDRVALVALGFIALLVLLAVFAPLIVKLVGAPEPNVQQTTALDDFGLPTGPSGEHLFGVDEIGRDVFSRVVYGAQVSLKVAIIGTGVSVVIGVVMGMLAGYYRGWVDTLIARVIDVLLAFPVLLLGMGLAVACSDADGCLEALKPGQGGLLQPGLSVVIFIIVLANWPYVARIIRGQVLSLREKEFVEAALMTGASNWRVIRSHLLPHLVAPIIVYSTLIIAGYILGEAALSFLGVGIELPTASWGNLLSVAPEFYTTQPWLMMWPGMAVILTTLAFNLLGDGLRDAFDPRGHG